MAIAAGIYYFSNNEEDWARPAVILIHSAGGNHLYWPPEVRRLGQERIYAIDLPGHGKSEGFGRQSIADYARCVLDFMDALKIRKAVFVGHSMGGAIALTLAAEHTRRTLGIGLISSSARPRVNPTLLEDITSPSNFPIAAQKITDWSFARTADARLKELALKRLLEVRPSVLQGDLNACDSYDGSARLGKIKVPALIMCGTEDKMTPPHHSQMLKDKIKGSILKMVDGSGHMLMLENPQAVGKTLELFLKSIIYQPGAAE
jgi:pimeloyl-ACP methyl ester carboxylesterase